MVCCGSAVFIQISQYQYLDILQVLTMIVLLFPPRAFCSSLVSVESRYGTEDHKYNKYVASLVLEYFYVATL